MANLEVTESADEEVPLGVFLSEEIPKAEITASVPTTAYWTGKDYPSCDEDS